MSIENDDRLRQELRLAQLEIKVLREQLLKSAQDAQRAREQMEELSARLAPAKGPEKKIIPLPQRAMGPATTNGAKQHDGPPRVLYVEDSEPNFRLMENVLRERPGTDLIWAETGTRAIELAQEKSPNLVLLDLDLPDIHGSKV